MPKKQNEYWDRYCQIGKLISYYRKRCHMTQEELAKKLNSSRQHLGAIEAPNVKRKLSMDLLFRIADILDVEPKCFLEDQDKSPEDVTKRGVK